MKAEKIAPRIISLMTDFGSGDDYIGQLHAVLYRYAPQARIIDFCHDIPAGGVESASFVLFYGWRHFPEHTVHLVIVDPGVGSERKILAASVRKQYFIAPDNGILHPILSSYVPDELYSVENTVLFNTEVSRTFQGRDIFAPVGAKLSMGLSLKEVGPAVSTWMKDVKLDPIRSHEGLIGKVMWIDHFGNLITNLSFDEVRGVKVKIANVYPRMVNTFADGKSSEPICYVGSKGTLEIALRDGNAAEFLKAGLGERVTALVM